MNHRLSSQALTEKARAKTTTINTVVRAFRLLDYFADAGTPLGVAEAARHLNVNTNMAFRLLKSIESAGYIAQDPSSGKFRISLKVLPLGQVALSSLEVRRWAMPCLEELSAQYPDANVNLAVLEGGDVIYVARLESARLPRLYSPVGRRGAVHATAVGKVLVSELDDAELEALVREKGLKRFTNNTITSLEQLKKELARVRQEGVAYDTEEHIIGVNCIAAPVRDSKGQIVASISLSAFTVHMSLEELQGAKPSVCGTAAKISFGLGYHSAY